jgi:uncharacterized protein YpmS
MKKSKAVISGIVAIIIIIVIVIAAFQINLDYEAATVRNEVDNSWQISGKFQIDKTEYKLGEKIFINIVELDEDEKGEMVFLRPLNSTHHGIYKIIAFDGSKKPSANIYFQPHLNVIKNICSMDQLVGGCLVEIRGTQYSDLEFIIINDFVVPEDYFDYENEIKKYTEPIC